MLRRMATDEGKAWYKLIPYVLFANREVPQSSTGFSPCELVYGHAVRGPLDVLNKTWESHPCSSKSEGFLRAVGAGEASKDVHTRQGESAEGTEDAETVI